MYCRGWCSREVDIKLMLQEFLISGVADIFLREEEEASVANCMWYGGNREECK